MDSIVEKALINLVEDKKAISYKPVLDHGFVVFKNRMGEDSDIANAARVSLAAGESFNDSRERTPDNDRGLLRYLMSHNHSSPFEMVELVFIVQAPLFVARQWFRYRTWSYNEVSGRYTALPTEMYLPKVQDLHHKSITIKQGRGIECSPEVALLARDKIDRANSYARDTEKYLSLEDPSFDYEDPIDESMYEITGLNLANELSRIVTPLSRYTRFYAKVDMSNFLKFLNQRVKSNAQFEIQEYARALWDLVGYHYPFVFEAFTDLVFKSKKLSATDSQTVKELLLEIADIRKLTKNQERLLKYLNS